ncbi:hypothetical protein CHH28_06250 [Bacterioplanes sanyensis]|uniref:Lipase chaperone n=1 Tax=Bacterioplanes sanyensis TaxID=1249553 RepID=A0A222FI90_9GAMM|nr:lipase secretion chaperone [Bacterioplanes sanyensis]ASP38306.1 hypothetical protein CHH28_06250 [Bacterioplanes sanyensis]
MSWRQGLSFVVLLGVVTWWLGQWRDVDVQQLPATSAGGPASRSEDLWHHARQARDQVLALNTYRGAQMDGALKLHSDQSLVIDRDLRHWIDFHLAALGEASLGQMTELMEQQIAALPQPARGQALRLVQRYLQYRAALADFDRVAQRRQTQEATSLEVLAERLDWQQRLRRQYFDGKTVAAFFADDELLDRYQLQRLQLADKNAVTATLPDDLITLREQTRLLQSHQQQEHTLREEGASDQQLQQWRTEQYGEVAAQRLQQLDQQQAQWRQRVSAYQAYQNSLIEQALDEQQRAALLQQYRLRHFSSVEQKRLPAALALLSDAHQ